jgi:hypothetical protein
VHLERIIPIPSTGQFTVALTRKAIDEVEGVAAEKQRYKTRREFWTQILAAAAQRMSLFQSTLPGTQSWIGASSGCRGVTFNFVAGRAYGRAEIYIDRGDKEQSDFVFDQLFAQKGAIETAFGGVLVWEKLDDKRANQIESEVEGNIFEASRWRAMIDFMVDAMARLEAAFRAPLSAIGQQLQDGTSRPVA